MGIIDELASKLRGAQRAAAKARREWDQATADASERRKVLNRCEARVLEIEKALSLLRNGLRTATAETSSGNVTPFKQR